MKWTEQQEQAISQTGNNILVSAAAGSGKTAVLTERIKRLVVDRQVPLDRILVVTFTNAAAAEMKEKILKALRTAADSEDTAPAERARLRRQIRMAGSADISTFHKFSMNVICRFFYITGADAGFSICDEGRGSILRERCLDELLEERFASGGQAFLDFMNRYSDLRSEQKVRSLILTAYDFAMSLPEPQKWFEQHAQILSADPEEFRKSALFRAHREQLNLDFDSILDRFRRVYDLVCDLPSLEAKAAADLDQLEGIRALFDSMKDEEAAEALSRISWSRYSPAKEDKESYEDIKKMVGKLRDDGKKQVKELAALISGVPLEEAVARMNDTYPYALYLLDLLKEFQQRFTEEKQRLSLMDFNDIEHEALRILRHEEAAAALRNHYQYIFIDEYQDSSVLQEEIIRLVSRGDNVYMVGDVKQSIYKFRLADPDIFVRKYNSFVNDPAAGIRIDLNRNFRSRQQIIHTVNGIFSHVMDEKLGGIRYDEAASLIKGAEIPGEPAGSASLHLVDAAVPEDGELDEEIAELKKSELEALVTAELVEKRLGRELFDGKTGLTRPVQYGDIVILMRGTRNRSDVYAKALADRGIPVYIEDGEGYFQTNEIDVFMNLLRVIDNRRQDIPLLSVLRSPIFGFTIDELADIRLRSRQEGGPRLSYSDAFLACAEQAGGKTQTEDTADAETDPLSEKCAAVLAKLDVWRRDARYMPLPDLIRYLMTETGYLHYVSALPGGDHRAANLRAMVDKAVDFSEAQGEGLFSFIHYAEEVSRRGVRIPQAGNTGDARQMVRIMTIHKSKGLEFPIVFVTDLARGFNKDAGIPALSLHKDLGLGLQYVDPERTAYSTTIPQTVIDRALKNESLAEEARILYVALTRAVDELVMVGSLKDLPEEMDKYDLGMKPDRLHAGCFLDWIMPYRVYAGLDTVLHDRAELSAAAAEEAVSATALKEELEQGFPSFRDEEGLIGQIQERFDYQYPFMPFVISKSKYTVTELNRALRDGVDLRPERVKLADEEHDPAFAEILEQKDSETARADVEAAVSEPPENYAVPAFLREEEPVTPALRGTLTHKVLELIPFSQEHTEESVKAFTRELEEKGVFTGREADAVRTASIAAFFRSETGRRAAAAEMLRREWAFTLKKRSAELIAMAEDADIAEQIRRMLPEEILIQGIIDCVFRDEQGMVILDFKTDRVLPGDAENEYARFRDNYWRQLVLYREVIEKATGEPVARTMLYMLDSGAEVEIL